MRGFLILLRRPCAFDVNHTKKTHEISPPLKHATERTDHGNLGQLDSLRRNKSHALAEAHPLLRSRIFGNRPRIALAISYLGIEA